MKKDIVIIRESIGRIVSMLTQKAIKVTQRGSRAYVKYHPATGAILEMNIPFIPDDASEEFIAAIQGFLDHEVGHVLFSDFAALKKAQAMGKRVANLANLVEDVFVERKMAEAFQGSGVNLESVRKFYLEKIARPKIEDALKRGAVEEAKGYATVAGFRAWGGQTTAMDFIREPKIAALLEDVKAKIGDELLDKLGRCSSSMDCLDLAAKIKDRLEAPKPPEEPPVAPPAPPEESEKGGGGGEPPDEDDDTPDEEPAEGEPGEMSDKPEPTKPAKSKEADEPPEAKEPDDEEGDDAKKPEEAEADAPESEEEDKHGVMTEGDGPEDLDKEGGGGKDSSDEPVEAGETGAAEDPTGDPTGTPGAPDAPPEEDPLAALFDEERDFDKEVGERLSSAAKEEIDGSAYSVFSKDWDKIEPGRICTDKSVIAKMEAGLADKLSVMSKHLERALAAQARKAWNPGQRRGRISPGGLFKTAVGDDRVFRQRFETKAKNTAVSLVVDCSGSMGGGRIQVAGQAAYGLSAVLDRLKIVHEVIGFTTYQSAEMIALMKEDAKSHGKEYYEMGWGRIEPLYMPVFKSFGGRLDTTARARLADLQRPNYLCQNVDGECVQVAAGRLKQQRAERHVMIVLSDGEPAASAARGLSQHLKKVVKDVTKQQVEVIGIGIQTSSVKAFYPKHVVLNDVEELPTRVIGELTKLLLAP